MTKAKYEDLVHTLTKAGVELRDAATGEFRDTYDIFSDLAKKWDELSSMEQSALANSIAGTRMQNIFFSLINNFKEASGAMDAMSESSGTLKDSYSAYLDTTEGKMAQLQATFQKFSQTMLSSSTSNFFVTLAQGLLQFLTVLSRVHALLPLVITAFTIWKSVQMAKEVSSLTAKLILQRNVTEQDLIAVQGLSSAQRGLLLSQIELAVNTGKLTADQAKQLITQLGLNSSEIAGISATNGLNFSLKALWATIKANPLGLIVTAITVIISALQIWIDLSEQATQNSIQTNREVISTNQEIIDQAAKLAASTNAIESYLSMTTLTANQESEFQTAISSVSSALGGKKIALKDTAEKQSEYLELLKATSEEERKAAITAARESRQSAIDNLNNYNKGSKLQSTFAEEYYTADTNDRKTAEEILRKHGLWNVESKTATASGMPVYIDELTIAPKSGDPEDIIDYYYALIEVRDKLAEQDDTGGDFYKELTGKANALKEYIEPLIKVKAQLLLLENPPSANIKTKDQFDTYVDNLINSSEEFKNASPIYIKAIRSVIEEYGNSYPEALDKATDAQQNSVNSAQSVIDSYKDTVAEMERLSVQISETKFGNIDTNNRKVLEWTEQNLNRYKEAIKSWGMLPSELAGSISTVLGMSDNFDGVEIAFTPMLQGENGAVLLDKSSVYEYINGLIKAAGEGWTAEDLLRLDAEGLEIDGQKIKNILADVGSTAIRTGQVMHFTGKDGALAQSSRELKELADEYGLTIDELLKKFDAKDVKTPATILEEDIKEATSALSAMKSAYSTVGSAIREYYKNGSLSSETLSKLISLEPQYLNLLVDEEGQLNLNSKSYEKLMKAKLREMLLSKMQSAFDTVLTMNAEEAAAYSAAAAYDTETDSIYGLLKAKMQIAMADAYEKDRANKTDVYSKAIMRVAESYKPLIALVDSYSLSTDEATGQTDKATKALNEQKDALENNKKALEKYKNELSDAQSDIKALIELVIEYLKQQKEDEKKVLEERKSNFDDLISKQKEELELKKESAEFDKKLKEKQNSVAKNALSASIASLDDSAAGRKAQKIANDALISSKDDLRDTLADHEYDIRVKALDKLKEASDKYYDDEIKKIDEYLSDGRKLYEDACRTIDNDTGDLYGKLWDYTYKYTSKTRAEFDELWSKAKAGLDKYDAAQIGVMGVMELLQSSIYTTKDQIDKISEAIDGVSDSIKALADDSLKQVQSRISGIKDEYDKLMKLMSIPQPPQDAQSSYQTFYGGYYYKLRGVTFSSTKSNREEAVADIISQVRQKFGQSIDVSPVKFEIKKYASGTTSAFGGASIVGERGAELRMLNRGDGIVTAGATKGLEALGNAIGSNPLQFIKDAGQMLMKNLFGNGTNPALGAIGNNNQIAPSIVVNVQGDATQSVVNALKSVADDIVNRATRNVMSVALRNKRMI